jgi:DNA (cytosine-5)-methyltransferase 1
MKVLDLFSGIGGFSLGLERAGMTTVAFCEIEPYCQRVLAKHWPGVPIYDDIRELTADTLRRDGIAVDVICGGWPCQDISVAGKREGIDGSRSGLWSEIRRLICDLRPKFAVMENSANLLNCGFERVLGELAAIGYDAEWHCLRASSVGAPFEGDRIYILATPYKIHGRS